MDQQIRLGRLLKKFNFEKAKVFIFLVFSRVIILATLYFLTKPVLGAQDANFHFVNFLKTFGVRWDGNSYTSIAKNGYITYGPERVFIVFPPFYPLLIKILSNLFNNFVLSGVILSNIFFIIGGYIFYKLLRFDYSVNFSFWVLVFLSFFPTSFFFSVAYPESLFLFLLSLSFFFLRKSNYFTSSMFVGLAYFTRPFGIMIWPCLYLYWYLYSKKPRNFLLLTLPALIFPSIYLYLNYKIYGNPFAFQRFLSENWYKDFTYPWLGIISSWKRGILTPEWEGFKIHAGYGEAIVSTLAWILVPISLIKRFKVKIYYSLYLFLGVLFFTSTGFILSAPRYLLSVPLFFIPFTKILKPTSVKVAWLFASISMLFYIAFEFAQGKWAF